MLVDGNQYYTVLVLLHVALGDFTHSCQIAYALGEHSMLLFVGVFSYCLMEEELPTQQVHLP
jgi:hypothetical protein